MFKLRFSKPFHKQYMDGKVSICKYECQIVNNLTKEIVSEFTVTGTAKCSPNDTVDPEFGKKLADSRAKLAAYKRANNRYPKGQLEDLIEVVNRAVSILEFHQTLQYLKKKEVDHIVSICSEV